MKFFHLTKISLICLLIGCNSTTEFNLQNISAPVSDHSMYPLLYTDNSGTVFMSWMEQKKDHTTLNYASFKNEKWSKPKVIAADSGWFKNWADFPSIIAQDGQPLAAHWLNKVQGGTYAYDINIAVNDDNWEPAFTPHQDSTATEHGFVSMLPASDTTFFATWLDGRNTAGRSPEEYSNLDYAMTLRGALISRQGKIVEKYLIDDSVCDCCNTALAKTESGFIIAYRNRTSEEIRDIYTVKIENGKISKPKAVHKDNWKIAACPVNGPAIHSDDNKIAVAWFTAANNRNQVKLAVFDDFGNTFSEPILVDDNAPAGRVDMEIINQKIYVSWLGNKRNKSVLFISTYTMEGKKLQTREIYGVSGSRSSGFPQISSNNNDLLIAITSTSEEFPVVKTYNLTTR